MYSHEDYRIKLIMSIYLLFVHFGVSFFTTEYYHEIYKFRALEISKDIIGINKRK